MSRSTLDTIAAAYLFASVFLAAIGAAYDVYLYLTGQVLVSDALRALGNAHLWFKLASSAAIAAVANLFVACAIYHLWMD